MSLLLAAWNEIIAVMAYIWSSFVLWIGLLVAPFTSPQLLWILVPVWISWFFSEFFQEKKNTSFGNAISNGVVPLWVAIDWTRLLVTTYSGFTFQIFIKFVICVVVFLYGLFIIIMGIQAVTFTHYFGRIREVTYVIVMFTPIIYGVDISFNLIFGMILFFPLFYYAIELIDYYTPDPEAIKEDNQPTVPNSDNGMINNNSFR